MNNKNKRGISVMIGYILLVSFAIIISITVYKILDSYAKGAEGLEECPEGVSLFMTDYNCDNGKLELTIINRGRFNIGGYFIHATTSPDQGLATEDLSRTIEGEIRISKNTVFFTENSFEPNDEEVKHVFDLRKITEEEIYSIDILPVIVKDEEKIISCRNSKIKEILNCGGELQPPPVIG